MNLKIMPHSEKYCVFQYLLKLLSADGKHCRDPDMGTYRETRTVSPSEGPSPQYHGTVARSSQDSVEVAAPGLSPDQAGRKCQHFLQPVLTPVWPQPWSHLSQRKRKPPPSAQILLHEHVHCRWCWPGCGSGCVEGGFVCSCMGRAGKYKNHFIKIGQWPFLFYPYQYSLSVLF